MHQLLGGNNRNVYASCAGTSSSTRWDPHCPALPSSLQGTASPGISARQRRSGLPWLRLSHQGYPGNWNFCCPHCPRSSGPLFCFPWGNCARSRIWRIPQLNTVGLKWTNTQVSKQLIHNHFRVVVFFFKQVSSNQHVVLSCQRLQTPLPFM